MDGFILMCWFWMMGHISGKHLHKKFYTPDFLQQIADSDPESLHVVIADQAGFHLRTGDERLPNNQ